MMHGRKNIKSYSIFNGHTIRARLSLTLDPAKWLRGTGNESILFTF